MKKLFLLFALFNMVATACEKNDVADSINTPTEKPDDGGTDTIVEDNKIYYTTIDGERLFPNSTEPVIFGAILISNSYVDGQGVLTFDDKITCIGANAFRKCTTLKSITIPNSVTKIEDYAFHYCTSLDSVTIYDSVTSINEWAFDGCESLKDVYVNIKDLAVFSSSNVICGNIGGDKHLFVDGCELTKLVIPNGVTTIGEKAFFLCRSIVSVDIPNSVTNIENRAFACCSLDSIVIPGSVISIGDSAFYQCKSLTNVLIGDGVAYIEGWVFFDCNRLNCVYCESQTPPIAVNTNSWSPWYTFNQTSPDLKIYVPNGSVAAYQNADGWSMYASNIVGNDF